MSAGLGATMAAGTVGPLRRLLAGRLPAPGEGPSRKAQQAGYFEIELVGEPDGGGLPLRGRVHGDRDPGHGSTSPMLGESAVCLARDGLPAGGGCWTPASVMGDPLLERLQANAGVTFEITGG